MVGMAMVPIMPRRFPGPVTVAIVPVGMAAIWRIAIAAVTITIRRPVMAVAGQASAQRQQQKQHGKR
jgi:hypothetical protein